MTQPAADAIPETASWARRILALVVDWLACDVDSNNLQSYQVLPDGRVAGILTDYSAAAAASGSASGNPSTQLVLLTRTEAKDAVLPTQWEGVSILPATIDLAGAEIELASVISRETRLRRHLRSLDSFDVAIVDCPPSLGMLTINALVASDKLIIPIQCEYYALEGVGQLSKTVGLVRDSLNPELEISGVLLTMYDSRTRLSNEVAEEVRRQFGSVAFSSVIPRNVRLSEAPSHAAPIGYYDPSSTGAQAYGDLAREVSGLWLKRAH